MTKKFIYLSFPLSEKTPAYGGEKGITIKQNKRISNGDSCNTEGWNISNHIGTHIDTPKHFFEEGNTIDEYPPEFWICNHVKVVDCPLEEARWILPEDLDGKLEQETDCVLIRTGFQQHRHQEVYFKDNPGLAPELGKWLRLNFPSLKFIGMDFISISRFTDGGKGRTAHREFLRPDPPGHPILPVEDIDLSSIQNGLNIETLYIFPLRVAGSDGAPVTIVSEMR